ncbi:MAG TPA: GNVR domain-containing protein [Terriglobales bacterium]|jgi:polysaccharide chain length determinant protein (PEP-CTERM system associated)|nr:GNVR domain-containing protein [Terriglobales bacterium]
MADDFLDEPGAGEQLDWGRYLGLLRRRRWYLILPFFCGWALVFGASWFLPSVYRSGTAILVEQPTVSQQYVVSNVASDLQSRLDSLTQQVLSRTRLLRIVDKLNLFPAKRQKASADEIVEAMRKNIQIELVRSPEREQLTSFNIYFSSDNPYVAQQVTTELTNILISENLEVRQQQSEDTTSFLQSQLDEARKNLAEQEARVRAFKDQHLGELPGQLQSNLQILSGMQAELQGEQDALGRAKQQNAYLESLNSQYRSQANNPHAPAAAGTIPGGLAAVDQELDRLKAQLADLSSRYTERHPDVRKVKDQIAKTEHMKAQLEADAANKKSAGADKTGSSSNDTAPMMEVQSQLKANEIETANRQRAISDLQGRISDYQSRLNRTPVREQELTDLTRDYDQSRTYYESLLAKRNQSELATNLERRQQSEHFRIIDPPSLPTKPYSPNRFKLSLTGLGAGLLLGIVATVVVEMMDDRIYDESDFKKMIPVDLMVEVPPLVSPEEEVRTRRMARLSWVAATVMGMIMMLGVAVSFLRS